MRLRLDNLPAEILHLIASHLDLRQIFGFSVVNKTFRSVSKAKIFRKVRVVFDSPESLLVAVQRGSDVLLSSACMGEVQHLEIVPQHLFTYDTQRLYDCGDRPLDTWKFRKVDQRDTDLLTEESQWRTLNALIRKLPALRKIHWCALEQIPRGIVKYIDQSLPGCRLYMQSFRLASLRRSSADSIQIEADEYELITSPRLYSITLRLEHTLFNDNISKAVMWMVEGNAPGLREVKLLYESGSGELTVETPDPVDQPKRILLPATAGKNGSLHTLDLVEFDSGQFLRSWSMKTDFSVLVSMKIHYCLVVPDFCWLAEKCQFPSLGTLAIKPWIEDGHEDLSNELAGSVEAFIMSLRPLKSVKLSGQYGQRTIDMLLNHSGLRLECLLLALPDVRSEQQRFLRSTMAFARRLQLDCPSLEELALPILRSQGRKQEVEVYQSLGHIPSIRKLHLTIYVSQSIFWDLDLKETEKYDDFICAGDEHVLQDIRDALIDLAMDAILAASIFRTISAAKSPSDRNLECLELHVNALRPCGGYQSWSKMINILQYIGRSWTCNRNTRDDSQHACFVQAYDPEDELCRGDLDDGGEMDQAARTRFSHLLLSVWPDARDGDWKEEWRSFPLAGY